jgi:hypothetical protein
VIEALTGNPTTDPVTVYPGGGEDND